MSPAQPPLSVLPEPRTPTGSYKAAGARLQEALRPTPVSEAARARRGLLRLKEGDAPAAARDLQCLAETDAGDLGFLLRLLEASERHSLAQVGAAPHGALTPPPPAAPRPWGGWGASSRHPSLAITGPGRQCHGDPGLGRRSRAGGL